MTTLTVLLQNNGTPLAPGVRGFARVPRAGRITLGYLGTRTPGNLVVDVLRGSSPDTAVSVTGSAPLTLTAATEVEDGALAGWSLAVGQGDWIGFQVVSASGIAHATAGLGVHLFPEECHVYVRFF